MKNQYLGINELLITRLTPFFLEKPVFWFSKNYGKIKSSAKKYFWWKNNVYFIEAKQILKLQEFLRILVDFNYEKTQTTRFPGEFSQYGGSIEIFPVNSNAIFRIEFYGNEVEMIEKIKEVDIDKEKQLKKKTKEHEREIILNKLKYGDYVVHLDHGIGIFKGIKLSDDQNIKNKFLVIEYAAPSGVKSQPDKLYVPVEHAEKISLYYGFKNPKISRLGSNIWEFTKKKAKEDVVKTAKELLDLYARREVAFRDVYQSDDKLESELARGFEYIETSDQLKALQEIEDDLTKQSPMDRVLLGDVGFGKTEIILRAAFKAVLNNRQVALLAPTTILANQHFEIFLNRFKKFPVEAALLSRFESDQKQKQIIKDLENGKIDIAIGTHRLLSGDVKFKNLGMLIIDEEQRFGVKQKEKIRSAYPGIDILSVSATPIPRTLYLSLSAIKNISVISTPPPGRFPIKTFVAPFDLKLMAEVVKNEVKRGGQVFYLWNKIATIKSAMEELEINLRASQDLRLKKIRLGMIHGRMSENEVLKIITDFKNKKIDILVSTTIIENGIDISNANTLIVADASRLGLAQAHQLRGRVGRGADHQAYAYFLHPRKLVEKSAKRLTALKEAEYLGAGYDIAMKDLEIRGAGNILGTKQSGNINKIGLNLYCQMLSEAVEQLKNNN